MGHQINTKEKLEQFVSDNWNKINEYIDSQMKSLPRPIYSSVDIRESKDKFAPVDHNIYPAGFNNLCMLDLDASSELIAKTLKNYSDSIETVGIIPESHTKNLFYLDNLAILGKTVRDAGFDVEFLSFDASLIEKEDLSLVSQSGLDLVIKKGSIKDGTMYAGEQKIDFAILNNDQSDPINLEWDLIQTPIHPSPKIGWFARQKIIHFEFYNKVIEEFCHEFDIDSNLLQARFKKVEGVDFSQKQGLETLSNEVDLLLSELPKDSNVFVKASQGTYGMGISVVNSGEEILSMNRKKRNKMDIGKNKIKFTSLLIQEGIETSLKYEDMPAEVAIYLIDGKSVGGFMRANSQKDSKTNLNSKGMVFKKFCISEIREHQDHKAKEAVYSLIARLSTLASCYEIKELSI